MSPDLILHRFVDWLAYRPRLTGFLVCMTFVMALIGERFLP